MPIAKGQRISPLTEFIRGQVSFNKLPVGSVTVRQHKGDMPRAWIKIGEPNIWCPRATHVWFQHHGAIPQGRIVHHVNENTLDDDIDNLAPVSRSHHRHVHARKLDGATRGMILPLKNVTCAKCKATYQAKAQRMKSFCPPCAGISERASKRRYKQKIRKAAEQQVMTPTLFDLVSLETTGVGEVDKELSR